MKDTIEVKIVNEGTADLPIIGSDYASGIDLRVDINRTWDYIGTKSISGVIAKYNKSSEQCVVIHPNSRVLIKTGLFMEIPVGYEGQVRPRSGLALNSGITIVNSPGTVDSDYRGEIGVILRNEGEMEFEVLHNMRIAQLVIIKLPNVKFSFVDSRDKLSITNRFTGGFGHTGTK